MPRPSWTRSRRKFASSARRCRKDARATTEELGDLLFALANLARKLGLEPEAALTGANDKFTRRFHEVERLLTRQGHSVHDASAEELDAAWNEVKRASATRASSTRARASSARSAIAPVGLDNRRAIAIGSKHSGRRWLAGVRRRPAPGDRTGSLDPR